MHGSGIVLKLLIVLWTWPLSVWRKKNRQNAAVYGYEFIQFSVYADIRTVHLLQELFSCFLDLFPPHFIVFFDSALPSSLESNSLHVWAGRTVVCLCYRIILNQSKLNYSVSLSPRACQLCTDGNMPVWFKQGPIKRAQKKLEQTILMYMHRQTNEHINGDRAYWTWCMGWLLKELRTELGHVFIMLRQMKVF